MTIPDELRNLVFEIPHFLSSEQCRYMIDLAEATGFDRATINSDQGSNIRPDIRNNDRVIRDDPDLAKRLWPSVARCFQRPFKGEVAFALNTRFRLYRYTPGQFFDWHQDGSFRLNKKCASRSTLMMYLNGDCVGGGTSFADVFSPHRFADFCITPETGKALLFHHPLSHRGDPVEEGRKYVLRTDVMFRPAG